jgi:hypothetical protein
LIGNRRSAACVSSFATMLRPGKLNAPLACKAGFVLWGGGVDGWTLGLTAVETDWNSTTAKSALPRLGFSSFWGERQAFASRRTGSGGGANGVGSWLARPTAVLFRPAPSRPASKGR